MALKIRHLHLLTVFALVFALKMIPLAECSTRRTGCLDTKEATSEVLHSRKFLQQVLDGLKTSRQATYHGSNGGNSNSNGERYHEEDSMVKWDLRKVPSGPDPLHHNGGSPKKPRTDP